MLKFLIEIMYKGKIIMSFETEVENHWEYHQVAYEKVKKEKPRMKNYTVHSTLIK
jgi:glycine betaine/choline ABC-type transport system substrate-binding protein